MGVFSLRLIVKNKVILSKRFADEPQEVTFQAAKGYLLAPKRRQIATQKATYYERIDNQTLTKG